MAATGSPTDQRIGQVFDRRYRVNELIGSGGMGSVYRATHLEMNREVALKVLDLGVADSDKQVQRFHQEARASSRLQHPNTIRVYDFGKADDGRLFLAMELLKGETLAELIRREKRLPLTRICHVLRQVCKSLAEAHQMGIIHRDLKPDNIFITEIYGEKDFVKVLDFGIAKSTEGPEQEALTQTGFICGTPRYLSPEQAMGRTVDPRSDLYALGILLYELVAGQPPFMAATPIGIVMKHIREDPPVLQSDGSNAGEGMRALVATLLAKTPDKRPSSAGAVGDALDAIVRGEKIPPPSRPATLPSTPVQPSRAPAPSGGAEATMMLQGIDLDAGPPRPAPSQPPPAPDPYASEATQFLREPVAAFPPQPEPAFPERVPRRPPAPPPPEVDDFEPTLARGLPPLDSLLGKPGLVLEAPRSRGGGAHPSAAAAPIRPPDTRPRDEQDSQIRTPSGLTRRPRTSVGLAAVDDQKPVAALAIARPPRREPTDEIQLPKPRRNWPWILAFVLTVTLGTIGYMVYRNATDPTPPRRDVPAPGAPGAPGPKR